MPGKKRVAKPRKPRKPKIVALRKKQTIYAKSVRKSAKSKNKHISRLKADNKTTTQDYIIETNKKTKKTHIRFQKKMSGNLRKRQANK